MITLTRLDGSRFVLNADLIETVESRPDTVIALVSKRILVVKEAPEVVIDRVVEFRHRIGCSAAALRPTVASTGWEADAVDVPEAPTNPGRRRRESA